MTSITWIKSKFKCSIFFPQLKSEQSIRSKLELNEEHFQLTIFPKNPNCSELVKNIFYPIKQITYNSFQINYSILQNVFVTNEGFLSFEIFNPVMHYDFSFSVTNIEEQGLVFRKKLKKHQIQSIAKSLLQAKANEIKRLMGSFISMVYLFKDCLETEQNKKQQIENILIPSYLCGKNYYEKNISIFKQNQKLKTSLKKSLMDKIKILESMLPEQEQIKQNLSCSCFDNLLNEFKVRSAVYIEESLQLFFTIINLENDTFDIYKISNSTISDNLKALNLNDNIHNFYKHNNNRDLNKSATFIHSKKTNPVLAQLNNENMNLSNDCYFSIKQSSGNKIFNLKAENLSNSTKTTSKKNYCVDVKESLETPKFYSNNAKYMMNNNTNKNIIEKDQVPSMQNIIKKIGTLTKNHSFVPPTNAFNIFLNTTEIIHRTFFDICIKSMKCDIFTIESDNNKIIKIDSLYNNFLFLRNLKNYLFNENNKKGTGSLLFLQDV